MHNFFINNNQMIEGKAIILGEDVNHIKNVLKMKIGEKIIVTIIQDKTSFNSEIETIEQDKVVCTVLDKRDDTEPNIEITLFQGLPKFDKMEFIIEKAVELGVYEIYPIDMKYSIAKVKDDKKIERWNKISETAAKQSKRNIIPKVYPAMRLKEASETFKNYDLILVCYENEFTNSIKNVLQSYNEKKPLKIGVVIGPEGGISKEEIDDIHGDNIKLVSLGKRILRTETAPVTALSMILYEFDL